ncbi:MAG: AMP-binding protein [Lachnospiraceae bacterium]|nr:AMP-binding protein [Lachnospiraceae bacterium]
MKKVIDCIYENRGLEKSALICGEKKLTYAQLWEKSLVMSKRLEKFSCERIALHFANSLEYVISYFAILLSGKTVIPIGYSLGEAEVAEIVRNTGATVIITDKELDMEGIGKIYLKCDYSDEDFAIEIDRLMHEKSFGALKQDDGSLFSFPAYYAVAGDYGRYEYALITGKNQIVYVALGGWKNTKKIPSEYLPRNYNAKAHEKDQAHYYSAYDEYANGTGRIDYSRKKDQTMPKYYYVKTSEDSFFLLRTEKNASGKEEIARCVFGRKGDANNMEENEIDELKALTGKEFTAVKETDGVINISYVVDGHEETIKYASKN